jgi:hypothetical protein
MGSNPNRLTKGDAIVGQILATDAQFSGTLAVDRSALDVADGSSMVASAAGIITNKIVTATPTTARTLTTDTAANIIALTSGVTGHSYDVTFINLSASAAAITLSGGTGVTIVGSATIGSASSATYIARVASATTVVLYRR